MWIRLKFLLCESIQVIYFGQKYSRSECVLIASCQVMCDFNIPITSDFTLIPWLSVRLHHCKVTSVPFVIVLQGGVLKPRSVLFLTQLFNLFPDMFTSLRTDSLFYSVNYNPSLSLFYAQVVPDLNSSSPFKVVFCVLSRVPIIMNAFNFF